MDTEIITRDSFFPWYRGDFIQMTSGIHWEGGRGHTTSEDYVVLGSSGDRIRVASRPELLRHIPYTTFRAVRQQSITDIFQVYDNEEARDDSTER